MLVISSWTISTEL